MNPNISQGGLDPASIPLKDIHLPLNLDWWPLAFGWWLLVFIILCSAGVAYWYCRKGRLKRAALKALKAIPVEQNPSIIADLSALIRRVSLQRYPRKKVARLTGKEWLIWLDKPFKNKPFSQGVGKILIEAPYQSNPDLTELPALLTLIKQWIKAKDV